MSKHKSKKVSMYDTESIERKLRLKKWITFYRRNLEVFAEHYFGIKLHPFQKMLLHLMGVNNTIALVMSRALGKSFLTALYSCCMAVLYPRSKIIITSAKISQSGVIVQDKIQNELYLMCPNLRREIKKFVINTNQYEVYFVNGSYIKVVTANDKARGARSTIIIYEEFRMIDKNIIDSVISPFNVPRVAPYMKLDRYNWIPPEQPRRVYISSAWWKSEWMWGEVKSRTTNMFNNQKTLVFASDLLLAFEHNLKTREDVLGEKNSMDELTFRMEYLNEMIGSSNNAYFTLEEMTKSRIIKEPFYPLDKYQIVKNKHKNNPCLKNRQDGEIRVLSVDVAMRKGNGNDNTAITCIRALPEENVGYIREYPYVEAHNGMETSKQALRIKQLFYEFRADYLVLDIKNAGISLFDSLSHTTTDPDTGEHYPEFTIVTNDRWHLIKAEARNELRERASASALPCIIPISASAELNGIIAQDFKKQFEDNKIFNLVDDQKADSFFIQNDSKYRSGDLEYRNSKILPFRSTSEFVFECINLTSEIVSNNLKLSEPYNGRKDRYSSASYGGYFITILERDFLRNNKSAYSVDAYRKSLNKIGSRRNLKQKYFL